MVLLAIILDILSVGNYFFQLTVGPHTGVAYWLGTILQIIFAVILLLFAITYKGKKNIDVKVPGYKNDVPTLRYSIIMASLILNIPVIFLYVLNLTGAPIIFGG
ncbi:hypothetical protein PL11_001970 [Lentilactobacillus curieae]|uniref:Uncharacterized protein n=1 Tax=Lentilactobacillus curieae TaxID=1138822 RepID=A0A1S6QGN0_9LACO|nr:hypothetical protein [Lentilactobacillus curieae]AQW20767.1 hypothetical protein PL11_001970 [Lentilactobacillus curieae]